MPGIQVVLIQGLVHTNQTFEQLPVDYLDHLFLHMPPYDVSIGGSCSKSEDPAKTCEEIMEQWKEMEKYVKNGKVKSLGISNFCPDCFTCLDFGRLSSLLRA